MGIAKNGHRSEMVKNREMKLAPKLEAIQKIHAYFENHETSFILCMLFATSLLLLIALGINGPIAAAVRFASGLVALLIIPGGVLSVVSIPGRAQNLAISLLIGIAFNVIACQILFLISITLKVTIPLSIWLISINTTVTIIILILNRYLNRGSISAVFSFPWKRWMIPVVFATIAVRLLLYVIADGCLAPDAALYSSYAREIIEGFFDSPVQNDPVVYILTDGYDYIAHQGFTYVFAVSWILMQPTVQGPTILLVILGVLLVLFGIIVSLDLFGEMSAKFISIVLAMIPILVFHSVVGYGPEITSLLFLVGAFYILLMGKGKSGELLLSGILIGLVEVVWYANFFIACLLGPALMLVRRYEGNNYSKWPLLLPLILIIRVFYLDIIVFYTVWTVVLCIIAVSRHMRNRSYAISNAAPLIGIGLISWLWQLPLQYAIAVSNNSHTIIINNPISMIVRSINLISKIALSLPFLFVHFTPIIILLVAWAVRGRYLGKGIYFLIASVVAGFGTLMVLSGMQGSLQFMYLYSDSRFFILTTVALVFSLGAFFERILENAQTSLIRIAGKQFYLSIDKRKSFLVFAILVGFIPSYIYMPSGLTLIRMEERYGWQNLDVVTESIGNESTIFLVNRAREFAWFTGRDVAALTFTDIGLDSLTAGREVICLSANFGTKYLLIDGYTIVKWKTLEYLLLDDMEIGSILPLNVTALVNAINRHETETTESLLLIAETEPNSLDRKCRLYENTESRFVRTSSIDLLTGGWSVTNNGRIENASGNAQIVIGTNQNQVTAFATSNIDLEIEAGYIIIGVEEYKSDVIEIRLVNTNGDFIRSAEEIEDNIYFCQLGDVMLGDLQIAIEGESEGMVTITSISIWNSE